MHGQIDGASINVRNVCLGCPRPVSVASDLVFCLD